ncbi:hypothetical protein [Rhodovulum sp. ES.010]|uniref:hypothetical protein n=1 Tax=Rhodovulum sp. ES.010 TaxID=1882821 RepID=UPI0015880D3E|nr:hypothetical protein [Rhodovulum sp. ES.010]
MIDTFPEIRLSRAACLWLAAVAALTDLPEPAETAAVRDLAAIAANATARKRPILPPAEVDIERAVRAHLEGQVEAGLPEIAAPRVYMPFRPVPIWLTYPTLTRDDANRKDSFIMHRFEAILSWVESMNLNGTVDDEGEDTAQKAVDDQGQITLSKHDRNSRASRKARGPCTQSMHYRDWLDFTPPSRPVSRSSLAGEVHSGRPPRR